MMSKAQKVLDLFEMANLWPERTGLPVFIWVDDMGKLRNNKHSKPRIKVAIQNSKDSIASISIDNNPKLLAGKLSSDIFNKVSKWVILNHDILIKHWNGEIDVIDMISDLKKI